MDDIYADIADLAGVRVALYFPAERGQVGGIISRLFHEYQPKRVFPDRSQTAGAKHSPDTPPTTIESGSKPVI
jgi:hypothetical protein